MGRVEDFVDLLEGPEFMSEVAVLAKLTEFLAVEHPAVLGLEFVVPHLIDVKELFIALH